MWQILQSLVAKGILVNTLIRSFGWLGWLLPVGLILKFIGWPILMVLAVLALPVLFLLLIVGLPIFVVLMIGGALMTLVGFLLTIGIALAKVLIPIALIVMIVRWLFRDRTPAAAAEPAPDAPAV